MSADREKAEAARHAVEQVLRDPLVTDVEMSELFRLHMLMREGWTPPVSATPEDCRCGWVGVHDPDNPSCPANATASVASEREALREQIAKALYENANRFHETVPWEAASDFMHSEWLGCADAVLTVLPSREVDGICDVCGGPGEFYDSPTGSWWSHLRHPSDEHDFEPKSRETVAPTEEQIAKAIGDEK